MEHGASLVAGWPVPTRECEGLWAVMDVEVFRLLTDVSGWTPDEYESWLAEVIDKLIPRRVRSS